MRMVAAVLAFLMTLSAAQAVAAAEPASRRSFVDTRLGQVYVLHLLAQKPSAKPPLVLIHETGLSSRTYLPFARLMAADREVFLLDLPGYGASDPQATPPSIEGYAGAMADGIGKLGLRRGQVVDVMGHHGGAAIAAQLSLDHPKRVRKLVFAGLAMDVHPAPGAPPYHRSDEAFPDKALRIAKRVAQTDAEARAEGFDAEESTMVMVDALYAYNRNAFLYEAALAWPGETRVPTIAKPSLILAFDDDLREHTLKSAKVLPGAQLVDMAPLGRLPYFRDPQKIAATVKGFLDR